MQNSTLHILTRRPNTAVSDSDCDTVDGMSSVDSDRCGCRRGFEKREGRREKRELAAAESILSSIDYSSYDGPSDNRPSLPTIADSDETIVKKLEALAPLIMEGRSLAVITGNNDLHYVLKAVKEQMGGQRRIYELWESGQFHRQFDPTVRYDGYVRPSYEELRYIEAMKIIWPGAEVSREHLEGIRRTNNSLFGLISSIALVEETKIPSGRPLSVNEENEYQTIARLGLLLEDLKLGADETVPQYIPHITVSEKVEDAIHILSERRNALKSKNAILLK